MAIKDKVALALFIGSTLFIWFTLWVYLVTGTWLPVEMVKNVLN